MNTETRKCTYCKKDLPLTDFDGDKKKCNKCRIVESNNRKVLRNKKLRCAAIIFDGTACKASAKPGKIYCGNHTNYAAFAKISLANLTNNTIPSNPSSILNKSSNNKSTYKLNDTLSNTTKVLSISPNNLTDNIISSKSSSILNKLSNNESTNKLDNELSDATEVLSTPKTTNQVNQLGVLLNQTALLLNQISSLINTGDLDLNISQDYNVIKSNISNNINNYTIIPHEPKQKIIIQPKKPSLDILDSINSSNIKAEIIEQPNMSHQYNLTKSDPLDDVYDNNSLQSDLIQQAHINDMNNTNQPKPPKKSKKTSKKIKPSMDDYIVDGIINKPALIKLYETEKASIRHNYNNINKLDKNTQNMHKLFVYTKRTDKINDILHALNNDLPLTPFYITERSIKKFNQMSDKEKDILYNEPFIAIGKKLNNKRSTKKNQLLYMTDLNKKKIIQSEIDLIQTTLDENDKKKDIARLNYEYGMKIIN